jgi:hypothetical protein
MSSPNLPTPVTSDDMLTELEMKLTKVDGTVRATLVRKLRKMIEQDPQKFANGIRHFLHQGSRNDDI